MIVRISLKTGTVMKGTKLGYRNWAAAVYLLTTNLKGVSSMRLQRDLEITQKSASHLTHRLRKGYAANGFLFSGPVQADETFIGGKEANKHSSRKLRAGRGGVGKAIVAGVKDRETNKVVAKGVSDTTAQAHQVEMFVVGLAVDQHQVGPDMTVPVVLPLPARRVVAVGTVFRQFGHDTGKLGIDGPGEAVLALPPVIPLEGRGPPDPPHGDWPSGRRHRRP